MNPSVQIQNNTHKNVLLGVVMLASFMTPFMGAAVNIALPKISDEFSLDAIAMSWVAMSYLLASAVLLVPVGKMADIVGRKKIFLIGMIIFTIGTLLCSISVSGTMLIISRVIQGLGSAMVFGTSMAIITSAFPPHERGKAIGMIVSSVYIGLSAAPVLGGLLTQTMGWRSIFYITILLCILVILGVVLKIKDEWAEAKNDKFDWTGSVIYMISMTALMYGFSKLPKQFAIILTLMGIAGMIAFVLIELRTKAPVLNISLFKTNRVFAFSNAAALINYAATFAVTFILSLYLQYVKNLTPAGAGAILVTQPILMAISAPIAGRLSDKFDSRILSSIGMTTIVAGLIPLIFITTETSFSFMIACLVILGLGFGLFSSPNTNSVMSSVEKRYLGVASATIGTMRLTGQMLSMGIATLAIHIFVGESKINPSNIPMFMHSAKIVFLVFSILCVLGIFASLARGKDESKLRV